MRLLKNRMQTGIAALEAAGFLAIITVLGMGIFAVGGAVFTRYTVDSVIETALSETANLQLAGRLAKQVVTGNGEIHYLYNEDRAQNLVAEVTQTVVDLKSKKSFLKSLPFYVVVSAYPLSIDEENGMPEGFIGANIHKTEGTLAVPSSVFSHHSIDKIYSEVGQATMNGMSMYAEPSGMVVYDSSDKKYLPFTPILTICLYVSDSLLKNSSLLESVFPSGVIASCQAIKVRDFI